MRKGKKIKDTGISLPDEQVIKDLGEKPYKYLGVLEIDGIQIYEMKNKIKEYYKQIRKVLDSKLNGENTIKAINTWAVTAVHYTARILD